MACNEALRRLGIREAPELGSQMALLGPEAEKPREPREPNMS